MRTIIEQLELNKAVISILRKRGVWSASWFSSWPLARAPDNDVRFNS